MESTVRRARDIVAHAAVALCAVATQPLDASTSTVEVRGHVLRDERPVEGADLRVLGPDTDEGHAVEVARGQTDRDGRFSLVVPWSDEDDEPAGQLLEIAAPGLAPRIVELEELYYPGPGAADTLGAIRLDRSCTVKGLLEAPASVLERGSRLVLWREGLDRPTAEVWLPRRRGSFAVRFRFPQIGPDSYVLGLVSAEGFGQRLGAVEACADERPKTWRVPPVSSVPVRVLDEAGDPVVGAALRALASPPEQAPIRWLDPPPILTDSSGLARVAYPTEATWILEVERPGFESSRLHCQCASSELHSDSEVTLRLRSAARIEGRVLDSDEFDLEGAAISVMPLAPATEARVAYLATDWYGEFESAALLPGRYLVVASAESHDTAEQIVEVSADALEASRLLFELREEGTGTLRVQVIDTRGEPVANAKVFVAREGRSPFSSHLGSDFSDTDGLAAVSGIPADVELSITAYHYFYDRPRSALAHRIDRDGSTARVTLAELPGGSLPADGVITDEDGRPVPDVRVEAFLIDQHSGLSHHAVTDPQGRFTVGPMPTGAYWVKAEADGFATSVSGVKVAPGQPVHRLTMYRGATLSGEAGGVLRGGEWRVWADRLLANQTAHSYEMSFSLRGYPSETIFGKALEDGYRIERVPPGRWVVVAAAGRGIDSRELRAEVDVAPGESSVRLDLEPLRRDVLDVPLLGRVVDADTDAGLDDVEVRYGVLLHSSRGGLAPPEAYSDAGGAFSLHPQATLPLRLFFHRDGYTSAEVLVTRETVAREIEVGLEPTPGLRYQVEWFDGAEVFLTGMALEDGSGVRLERETFPHDEPVGHWRSAARGRWTLAIEHRFGELRVPVNVPGPELRVVIPPSGGARLRVPDLELEMGAGWLADVVVTASPIDEPADRTPVTDRAVYDLGGLAPGLWRIDVRDSRGRNWSTDVEIFNRRWVTASFR